MTLNEILGEENCRILTEYLGDHYHRPVYKIIASDKCKSCSCGLPGHAEEPNLDFSDWRVVGRLMGKCHEIAMKKLRPPRRSVTVIKSMCMNVHKGSGAISFWCTLGHFFGGASGCGIDEKEAFLRSVLAYIKEGEK